MIKCVEDTPFIITENDTGRRIDRIIRKMLPGIPLSRIYRAIRKGEIRLNKQKVKPETLTQKGDLLYINRTIMSGIININKEQSVRNEPGINPEDKTTDMEIIFENSHILVVNKPAGLLVHGENSLEKMVKAYLSPSIPQSLSFEPGPVHRLDRNTSGLIFFSKSLKGARLLSDAFKKNLCEKYYLGLFDGRINKEAEWRDRLSRDKQHKITLAARETGAPEAVTKIKPLFVLEEKTIVLCRIITGVTHQIRAQGMIHGHPLTGDKKYGSKAPPPCRGHYILHSWCIRFPAFHHYIGRTSIVAPLPGRPYTILNSLCRQGNLESILSRLLKKLR